MIISLRHGKVTLALHGLRRDAPGRALLLLHGRGLRSPTIVPERVSKWPGPIWALDFTGHGASSVPRGGGYSVEILMADADAALAQLGSVTLLGNGLGAYVALLLAGARPQQVRSRSVSSETVSCASSVDTARNRIAAVPSARRRS